MKVGKHVVCINDQFVNQAVHSRAGVIYPQKGTVYTVREIIPVADNPKKGAHLSLRLEEISNLTWVFPNGTFEPFFACSRFRPLQKLKVEDFIEVKAPKELA